MSRQMILETLKKSRIFSVLSDKQLTEISPFFEELDIKKDGYVFHEGDESEWLYIVARAQIKMAKHTLAGKDVIVEIKSPGGMFCCASVLDSSPYPESAQAMQNAVLIRISRQNLLQIIEKYPVLKIEIAQYASDKLRDAYDKLKNIATEKVEKRIASVLLKLTEQAPGDHSGYSELDFSITRQEIAEMVGATVETCIRTIREFEKQGMVKSSGRRILVRSDALRKFLAFS